MKISVITVCFNSVSTLPRTLLSVFSQDWPNIEHIVIDGASTDGSIETLERHQNNIAHIVSEPDEGIYDAMNKGLSRASGDIICFLNADDFYTSSAVLSRVAIQMRSHDLDALIGDVGYFRPSQPDTIVRRYRSDRFTPERLAWGWMPAHPGLFLSKAIIDRVGLFRTDYEIAADYEYVIRVFHNQTLAYKNLPEIIVHMQLGGASTNGIRARLLLNKEVLRACRDNGVKTNMLKILSKYPTKLLDAIRK